MRCLIDHCLTIAYTLLSDDLLSWRGRSSSADCMHHNATTRVIFLEGSAVLEIKRLVRSRSFVSSDIWSHWRELWFSAGLSDEPLLMIRTSRLISEGVIIMLSSKAWPFLRSTSLNDRKGSVSTIR